MALPNFGSGDKSLFATKREGSHVDFVPDPKIAKQIADLFATHGIVQGQDFVSATKAETEAYNDKRASEFKSGKTKTEPRMLTVAENAARKARAEAAPIVPYANAYADSLEATKDSPHGFSASLRTINQGTEDAPKVLWAFVLVNGRKPRSDTK